MSDVSLPATSRTALVLSFSVAPLVGLAVRLDVAFAYALIASVMLVLSWLLVRLFRRIAAPAWVMADAFAASAAIVTLIQVGIDVAAPGMSADFGPYLPVLVLMPLVVDQLQVELGLGQAAEGIQHLAGLAGRLVLFMVAFAVIRELVGDGTLTVLAAEPFRLQLAVPGLADSPAGYVATASGGFILAGLFLALRAHVAGKRAPAPEAGR